MAALVVSVMVERPGAFHPDQRFARVGLGLANSADEAREKAVQYLLDIEYKSAEVQVSGFRPGAGSYYFLAPTT